MDASIAGQVANRPCHSCRRRRLLCDRTYPHCSKCASRGVECLGYGTLLLWTGAVAIRGKLAGQPSTAALCRPEEQRKTRRSPNSRKAKQYVQASSGGARTPDSSPEPTRSPTRDVEVHEVDRSRSPSFSDASSVSHTLTDPLFQDSGYSLKNYFDHCKKIDIHSKPPRGGLI